MNIRLFNIITLLFLVGCTVDSVEKSPSYSLLDLGSVDTLHLPDGLSRGVLLSAGISMQTKSMFVPDYVSRHLYHIDMDANEATAIGSHGEGPGEYYVPSRVQVFDSLLVYSDIQSLDITVSTLGYDSHVRVNHTIGNAPFWVENGHVYALNHVEHMAIAYPIRGTGRDSFIPIPEASPSFAQQVSGGGVAVLDDTVYAMNSLEPAVYYESLSRGDKGSFVPPVWDEMLARYEALPLGDLDMQTWREVSDEYATFSYFGMVESLDGAKWFIASGRFEGESFLTIFARDGLLFHGNPQAHLIGASGNRLVFEDTSEVAAENPHLILVTLN